MKKTKRPWKQPNTRMIRIREKTHAKLWRIAKNDNRELIATVEELTVEGLERRGMARNIQ